MYTGILFKMDQTTTQLEQRLCHAEIYPVSVLEFMEKIRCGLRAPHHGLGLVMGYDEGVHSTYLYKNNEDIFAGREVNISDEAALDMVLEAVDIDGVLLVDAAGNICHSGYYLDVSPFKALEEMGVPNHSPLWQRFGFSKEVGTRHLNLAAGSYFMHDAQLYVISGESNRLTSLKGGKIVYSAPEQIRLTDHYLQ